MGVHILPHESALLLAESFLAFRESVRSRGQARANYVTEGGRAAAGVHFFARIYDHVLAQLSLLPLFPSISPRSTSLKIPCFSERYSFKDRALPIVRSRRTLIILD